MASSRQHPLPFLLLLLTSAWGIAVLAAPWLAAGAPGTFRVTAATGIYLLGSGVCHQRAERSFHVLGAQAPVCARCHALYVAAGCGAIVFALPAARGLVEGSRAVLRPVILATAVPTALSWGLERLGWVEGTPAIRAALAVPLGVAIALMVVAWWRGPGGRST